MNITKITPTTPNCYGVCCPPHGRCDRYHAVDGAVDSPRTIATCLDMVTGERPLFIERSAQAV